MNIIDIIKQLNTILIKADDKQAADDAISNIFAVWKQNGYIRDRGWEWKQYANDQMIIIQIWITHDSHVGAPNHVHAATLGKPPFVNVISSNNSQKPTDTNDAWDRAMSII